MENSIACGNPEYLRDLRESLEDELFAQHPDSDTWPDDDPRNQLFVEQAGAIAERTADLRLSCAKFSIGIVIEGSSATPDLSRRSCMLALGETCPIEAQVQALRDQYGESFPDVDD